MAAPKVFAGLTWQQISFIFIVVTPILTIQTLVLNLMAKGREYDYQNEHHKENIKFLNQINDNFKDVVKSIDNVYSMSDITDVVDTKVKESEKGNKDYTDSENKKQEDFYEGVFKNTIESVFFLDENDSTFKVLFYRMNGDSVVVIKMIPILTSDWEKGNY